MEHKDQELPANTDNQKNEMNLQTPPQEKLGDEVPTSEASEEIASKESQEEVSPVVEMPEEVPAEESPEEVPAEESPEEVPAEESPEEVPAQESPKEVPAEESPKEVPAEESPEEVPAEESPEEVPAEESPDEVPAEESPEEFPAEESPEEVPAEESPEEVPAEESPEEVPAEESPEEVPAEESPEEVPAEESPEEVPAEESPEEVPAEESPEEVTAEESPEEVTAEESPEEVTAEESPEEVPVQEGDIKDEKIEEKEKEKEQAAESKSEDESEGEGEGEDEEVVDDAEETEEKYQSLDRAQLTEALEEALQTDDISKVKRKISLIRVNFLNKTRELKNERFEAFIAEGGEKDSYDESPDELELKFHALFTLYKERKAAWGEEQEKIRLKNLEAKQQILEELKVLISSEESLKKTYDEFKVLQEKWSGIGMVPRTETNNLWQNYHFLVEKFFDKVKINKELRDLDLKKNLESKVALCEKADELLLENSLDRSFRLLQQYHREWKEIGPVPMDKKDEVWERFKHITDLINERRREHYDQRQEEYDQNLLAKNALCDQVEELVSAEVNSIKAWQEQTDNLNELFKIWKSVGPAPRSDNDKVWQRFRGYMEAFYAAKKEYFDKLKDEQLNNYNVKLDLCVQAEALQQSTDWKNTTRELINMQKRWKEIGAVPRKHSEKIWKRFRAACDAFFENKDAYFKNIHSNENENLEKKESLIKRIEEQEYSDDKAANLALLKSLQREWMEVGFVPIKEKDRLQKAFRDAIDKKLKELNISSVEMSRVNYREKIDTLKDKQDGGRLISKERMFLQNKVKELQDEIHLWENNLGFLANSKKADMLKEEFAKKIEKAKQDLALMEAKVKMLRDA